MKKIFFVILMITTARVSYPHPPTEITAEYDTTSNILQVTINHMVHDAQKHYINKIEIDLNDARIIEQKSKRQTDKTIQQYTYQLPDATIDDKISIKAYCNISGKKRITVPIKQLLKESEH